MIDRRCGTRATINVYERDENRSVPRSYECERPEGHDGPHVGSAFMWPQEEQRSAAVEAELGMTTSGWNAK